MSDDWREFLKEVHEQNRQQMELSKQREQNVYDEQGKTNEFECESCEI